MLRVFATFVPKQAIHIVQQNNTPIRNRSLHHAIRQLQADEKLIAAGAMDFQLFSFLQEKASGNSRTYFDAMPSIIPLGETPKLLLTVRKDGYRNCCHQMNHGSIFLFLPFRLG